MEQNQDNSHTSKMKEKFMEKMSELKKRFLFKTFIAGFAIESLIRKDVLNDIKDQPWN